MNTILISYDLQGPETSVDYKKLIDRLKEFSKWCKPLKSFWLVRTEKTAPQVLDVLIPLLDNNDKIFAVDVTHDDWSSYGLSEKTNEWFNDNL